MEDYTYKFRLLLQDNANTEKAAPMKKYMKNRYDFFGIASPERKMLLRAFLNENGYPINLDATVKSWWAQPEREFQYAAMEILDRKKKKVDGDFIQTYEYLVAIKSWWDTVDFIAAKLIGYHFQAFPELLPEYLPKWMDSGNIWLQRSCLLFQLKYKQETDWMLLQSLIHPLKSSKEFFIRKSIGWVLREYSKTYPDKVIAFVMNNENELSGLSRTEALKVVNR